MAVLTLNDVLVRLDAEIAAARAGLDRNGFFAALYARITREIQRMVVAGEFADGARMERLDVAFANRYFDALDASRANRAPSRCWGVAFSAAKSGGLIIFQHLLLAINAHINFDLGIAAAEVCPNRPALDAVKPDFDLLNQVFQSEVDEVENLIGVLSPQIALLDQLAGNVEERLVGFSLIRARERAWSNAAMLVETPVIFKATILSLQDGLVASFGQAIRSPFVNAALTPIRVTEETDVGLILDALT